MISNKEMKIQTALGTLSHYKVAITTFDNHDWFKIKGGERNYLVFK